jgi:hypothetical protein
MIVDGVCREVAVVQLPHEHGIVSLAYLSANRKAHVEATTLLGGHDPRRDL